LRLIGEDGLKAVDNQHCERVHCLGQTFKTAKEANHHIQTHPEAAAEHQQWVEDRSVHVPLPTRGQLSRMAAQAPLNNNDDNGDTTETDDENDSVENHPFVDDVENDPFVDGVENDPVVDGVKNDPVVDGVENDPVLDGVENDPVVDDVENDAVVDDVENNAVADDFENNPVLDVETDPVAVEIDPVAVEEQNDSVVDNVDPDVDIVGVGAASDDDSFHAALMHEAGSVHSSDEEVDSVDTIQDGTLPCDEEHFGER